MPRPCTSTTLTYEVLPVLYKNQMFNLDALIQNHFLNKTPCFKIFVLFQNTAHPTHPQAALFVN